MILDEVARDVASAQGKPFHPRMKVVGCFVRCEEEGEDKILLLQRAIDKPQPLTYGIPSGKAERGQPLSYEVTRELWEETQILHPIKQYLGCARVRFEEYDFEYHMFGIVLQKRPDVIFRPVEHIGFEWVAMNKLRTAECLIQDMWACIEQFYLPRYPHLVA